MIMKNVCGVSIPADSPTVGIAVEVPVHVHGSTSWLWRTLPTRCLIAEEYVYNSQELNRVMRSYGLMVATLHARTLSSCRFRLVARGLFSGRVIGTYTWEWSAVNGHYEPESEPWLMWDEVAHDNAKRIGYSLSGFNRMTCPRSPVQPALAA